MTKLHPHHHRSTMIEFTEMDLVVAMATGTVETLFLAVATTWMVDAATIIATVIVDVVANTAMTGAKTTATDATTTTTAAEATTATVVAE